MSKALTQLLIDAGFDVNMSKAKEIKSTNNGAVFYEVQSGGEKYYLIEGETGGVGCLTLDKAEAEHYWNTF